MNFKTYQSHETLIDVDRTVCQFNPVVRPSKLDVQAQVQGEGVRVNLIEKIMRIQATATMLTMDDNYVVCPGRFEGSTLLYPVSLLFGC